MATKTAKWSKNVAHGYVIEEIIDHLLSKCLAMARTKEEEERQVRRWHCTDCDFEDDIYGWQAYDGCPECGGILSDDDGENFDDEDDWPYVRPNT